METSTPTQSSVAADPSRGRGEVAGEETLLVALAAAQGHAHVLRDEAAHVRALSHELARAKEQQSHLETALGTRDVIGQAKGILMERHRVDADAAFEMLRARSQALNMKLLTLADHLARTGELL